MGLSPGLDFESRLFVKEGAAALLERELSAPGYQPRTIAIGTNTEQDNQGASDQHEDCGDDSKPTDDAYGAARQRRVEAITQAISCGDWTAHERVGLYQRQGRFD